MSWQILLLINLFSASLREFLNKKIANTMEPVAAFINFAFFGFLWFVMYQLIIVKAMPRIDLTVSATGFIIIIAYISYLKAVKISLSQSILYQSYSIIVTVILAAIFLGEGRYLDIRTGTGVKIVSGIILAFVSLWFLLHVGRKRDELLERKWFYYIAIVIVFFGVSSFFTISFFRVYTPIEVLISQSLPMIFVLPLYQLLVGGKIILKRKQFKTVFLSSIFASIAVVAFYFALMIVPVAKFYPIQQVSLVILTILQGVLFYKEANVFSGNRLVGMIIGMAGIMLLVLS